MWDNVGPSESKLRVIIGLVLIVVGFTAPLPDRWHMAVMAIALTAMFTAIGFCPLKALLFRGQAKSA